jgi:hypothetical protein
MELRKKILSKATWLGRLTVLTAAMVLMVSPQNSNAQINADGFTWNYPYFWIYPNVNMEDRPGVRIHWEDFMGGDVWFYYYDEARDNPNAPAGQWWPMDMIPDRNQPGGWNWDWPPGYGGHQQDPNTGDYYRYRNGCYAWYLYYHPINGGQGVWADWYYCCRWHRDFPGPTPTGF